MATTATTNKEKRHLRKVLENYIIVCLVGSYRQLDDLDHSLISQLRRVVNTVEIFTDSNTLADFVSEVQYESVFWIVLGDQGKMIVPLLHELPQIYSVYILSDDTLQSKGRLSKCDNHL
jgi:hypothetical protein